MRASLKRIIKNSWLNIKRQGPLTFATVSIMVMTISFVTFLFFFQGIVTFLVNDLENKVDVSVYFKRDALEEEVVRAKDEIGKISEIKNIEYLSKDEALARFAEKHKDDPKLLEAIAEVGDNPLLSSLSIKTWQANQYESVANFLTAAPFKDSIEKVDYNQNKLIINKIFSI